MRVLLVQPDQNRTLGLQQLARVEPLGLEMLAGALLGAHEVALLDLRVEPDGLERTLEDVRPDLVGISSTFTIDLPRTVAIARAVKAWDGRTFVVVGGHRAPRGAHEPCGDERTPPPARRSGLVKLGAARSQGCGGGWQAAPTTPERASTVRWSGPGKQDGKVYVRNQR